RTEDRETVELGNGDGTFTPASAASAVGLRNTPYLADLNGDGIPDSVVLDTSGHVLFRQGLPGPDSPFAPPVTLDDAAHLGEDRPARDLPLLHPATGLAIATADARFDPGLSSANHFVYTVSLYRVAADGSVLRTTLFSTPRLPSRIAAADLTGNGLDDVVV